MQATLTTDDIWNELERIEAPMPHEPRALGARMLAAMKAGWIYKTGRWVQSNRPVAHRAELRVYGSRVCLEGVPDGMD